MSNPLAIDGGSPVRSTGMPPRGLLGEEERQAVDALFDAAISSGNAFGYNGAEETAYCEAFARLLGGGFVDGVNSGTTAVYVALKALDLPAYSEVIVGCVTDPGGMMPIPLLNLIPMVADTVPGSFNTGPEQVEALITERTSAIVVAHISGEPADMPGIMKVAAAHDLPVIEDCAQAHGAFLDGTPLGAFGTLSAFSTMSGKHHCSGSQGGLVYTADEALYARVRHASDRGKPFALPAGSSNCMASLNLNLSDLAGAVGAVQLRKLPDIVRRRRDVADALRSAMASLVAVAPSELITGAQPSYWFLRGVFDADAATCDKMQYCQALAAEGLPVNASYRGALPHLQDWFRERQVFGTPGLPWSSPDYAGDRDATFPCPNAEAAMDACFLVAVHEGWDDDAVGDAISIFRKVDAAYAR
jgi:dTDP-4-amino-4,6-dideoxygalactose transaminase